MYDTTKAMGNVLKKSFFLAHNFLAISMTSITFSSFFSSMVVYFMSLELWRPSLPNCSCSGHEAVRARLTMIAMFIFIVFMCTLYNENTLRCKILCKSTNNFRKAFVNWEDIFRLFALILPKSFFKSSFLCNFANY